MLKVEPVSQADRAAWLAMRVSLYPGEPTHVIKSEIDSFLKTGKIADREHGVLIAHHHTKPVGFVEVSDFGHNRCHIESWYVMPGARSSGIGRALVTAGEHWARSRGASVLTSDTNENYPDSPPAHKACGFRASSNDTLFEKQLGDQS